MGLPKPSETACQLIEAALSSGASLAGLASAEDVEKSPSAKAWKGKPRKPLAGSILVLGLVHAADNPALDWWDGPSGGTPGNRQLIDISRRVSKWLRRTHGIASRELAYAPEQGGVFLKDAAALAGLGTIGKNNLLVTPQFGPRVRLRALLLEAELPPTAPLAYLPCDDCDTPCFRACPQEAFSAGAFRKNDCLNKMEADESAGLMAAEEEGKLIVITYCRECELACPIGN